MPTSPARPLILASASPRRAELLRTLGVSFTVRVSGVEEVEGGEAAAVALENARRKAGAVADLEPGARVLGADTVVALDGRLYGKPRDAAEAAGMLAALSGRTHEVTTGVVILCRATGERAEEAVTTRVTFRNLTDDQIAAYLARVPVLDKAGAYAIQERGDELVLRVEGSFSNVVGLPLERVQELLAPGAGPGAPPY